MKCSNCGGTGKEYWNGNVFCNTGFECDKCNGTGEIELVQTNEKWLDRKSTKEKAEWLDKVAENCCQICDEENRELCRANIATGCKFENAEKWEMWLKQPHTNFVRSRKW